MNTDGLSAGGVTILVGHPRATFPEESLAHGITVAGARRQREVMTVALVEVSEGALLTGPHERYHVLS